MAFFTPLQSFANDKKFTVIAHRGASGYLPEHTLESTALAHGMGADFIEPDVVLTKDDIPIVLHDIHLESTTDVAEKFPSRLRSDRKWYAIDFTLAEIKTLKVHERTAFPSQTPVFPKRFPSSQKNADFRVPTLQEQITLIQGLNKSRGMDVGIYPEIKNPAFHEQNGKNSAKILLSILASNGYKDEKSSVIIQCFDPKTLQYIRFELKSKIRLTQLVGIGNNYPAIEGIDSILSASGLQAIAKYANGIAPHMGLIAIQNKHTSTLEPAPFIEQARKLALFIHPYTLRADDLPPGIPNYNFMMSLLKDTLRVDGVFTDFPDLAVMKN